MRFLGLGLIGLAWISWISGCDCAGPGPSGGEGAPCTSGSECRTGLACIDSRCTRRPDASLLEEDGGGAIDGGCPGSRACGATCCDPGTVCGGELCCAPTEICGVECCGADERCDVDRCVLDCGDRALCDDGTGAVCCGDGDVCYLGACVTPGAPCTRTAECPDGEYCESTAMRCLPRATGEACEWRPPAAPFAMTEEWSWTGDPAVLPGTNQVMMAPMVASLTDDDGDGDVDRDDVPDVIFHSFPGSDYWTDGVIRAVSGDDGHRLWPTADPGYRVAPGGEIAIAEMDAGSPGPELAVCSSAMRPSSAGHLMILSAAGTLLRRFDTAPNDVPCGFDAPAIGDMDGDGAPEIVVRYVIAHADGTVVRRVRTDAAASGVYATLADVDGDMDLDLVGSNGVYDYDGSAIWERTVDMPGRPVLPAGAFPAVADLDLDGDAEIVLVSAGAHSITAVDADTGDTVWGPFEINPAEIMSQWIASPSGGGPPTIANFDADPNPEIAFAGGYAYVIFGHDGVRQWWFETVDRSSRVTGSSIFDFEGDGVAEVLYNDERTFRVFRGTDGTVLFERCNTSGTLREYPIVADVDGDDQAEIILMENNYAFACLDGSPSTTGIHVFGHPRGEWVRTRRIWNQHTYHVTNVDESGRVPAREEVNWTRTGLNNFRQNVQPDGLFDAPDLVLADLAAGLRSCPTSIEISVRVVNRGTAGAPSGVPVTFYRVEATGRTRLGRAVTTRPLLPGESERLVLAPPFAIPAGMEREVFQFVAVINDATDMPLETLHQCREENDESAITSAQCPTIM